MTEQANQGRAVSTKTYVRGTFLYSTDDGTGYEQRNRNRVEEQIIIEDKGNINSLKRQIQSKKQQIIKKKEKSKKQKQMLIPIRDTPVQPLPQPMTDNNKCQRATQQQFQYFQTYISQKQKQRKFEEQQNKIIDLFQKQQQKFRKNPENQSRKTVSIVLEKNVQSFSINNKINKKLPFIKVLIKKKYGAEPSVLRSNAKLLKNHSQNKKDQKIKDSPRRPKQQQEQHNDDQQLKKVRIIQSQP